MAMMPSAEASSGNLYDSDAVERDLIDPDDGTLPAPAASLSIPTCTPRICDRLALIAHQLPSMISTTLCMGPRTGRH